MVGDVVAAGSGYLYRVQSLFGEALPPDRGRPSPSRAPCGSHVVGGCRSRAGKHVRDLRLVEEDGGGAALDGTAVANVQSQMREFLRSSQISDTHLPQLHMLLVDPTGGELRRWRAFAPTARGGGGAVVGSRIGQGGEPGGIGRQAKVG
uniref:Uncharacterized protein n=1 Tax=Oryza nivara TaxID=4536 RepID=A0A0E0H356_ORYNI